MANDELYLLRMKHQRAGRTDINELRADTERYLSRNNTPNEKESEILGEVWNFLAENIEREEWRNYTREDWEALERQHVEKSRYTKPDLFDDITTAYEKGELTEDEAKATALQYRECKYRFCLNVFNGRKDQRYCSADCRKRAHRAEQRFIETGTYLPPSAYKDNREDTDDRNYKERERAFEDTMIIEELEPFERSREYGYRRDRERELFFDIINENSKNSVKIRHKNHVSYEEEETEIRNDKVCVQAGRAQTTF